MFILSMLAPLHLHYLCLHFEAEEVVLGQGHYAGSFSGKVLFMKAIHLFTWK